MLSLTKYLPYPGIPHAGGQYLLAHDRALRADADIDYFAPDTPLNRAARPRMHSGVTAQLLAGARLGRALFGSRWLGSALFRFWQLESVLAGSSIYLPVRRLFRGSRAPWQLLAAADVIELQWSEMIALAPLLRRRFEQLPLVGVAHDVITQRLEREVTARGSRPRRALLRIAAAHSRKREAASFAALDVLIVFSEKDAELARNLVPGTRVEVVHPGLGPNEALARVPSEVAPMVLFTGAMNRPENWQGVSWFLAEIWPSVHEAVPNARFVIAGANPPAELSAKVAAAARCELTGFVDSLEPYYAEASVVVAPLRSGAGVKFKTVDALLRGVPVVTTSVGAEGIDSPEPLGEIVDDARGFAEAVVRQLRAPDEERVRRLQQWADGVYGVAAFEQRLRGVYAGVRNA